MPLKDFGNGVLGQITGNLKNVGQQIQGVYRVLLDEGRIKFNELLQRDNFDIKQTIERDSGRYSNPVTLKLWIKRYLRKHSYRGILIQGQLYYFTYNDPLTKDKLEFYDTTPLILSFGLYAASTGNLIEYGINLHMLPMQVRKAFLIDIFNAYRKQYKSQMYSTKHRSINELTWEQLQVFVEKYKISFAVRSYIPTRRNLTVMFEYEDWGKAVCLPSAKLVGINDTELMNRYRRHCAEYERMKHLRS